VDHPFDDRKHQILGSHAAAVSGMIMVADGDYLVTASRDGTMIVWPATPQAVIRQACNIVGRSPTRDEWASWLPNWPYAPICV
jgi:hypothetical protein